MKLFLVKLPGDFKKTLILARKVLSEIEQTEVDKFRFYEDKIRKTLSFLLIKYFAEKEFALTSYTLNKNEYGKPFFDSFPNANFNISHSGEWVAGVIADSLIGVDVEEIKPIKNQMDIAHRFFSEKEFKFLTEIDDKNSQLTTFYEIWTKKESLIKAVGKGLSISLGSFNVPLLPTDNSTVNYLQEYWSFLSLKEFDPNYKISICVNESTVENLKIKELSITELCLEG